MKGAAVGKGKVRADQRVVDLGLAPSKQRAQALILAGLVLDPDGKVIAKAGQAVADDVAPVLKGEDCPFVSRGGLKLQGALDHFAVDPSGWVVLDVGASTGGFTDCLLQRGAVKAYAVDVGTHQLHEKLLADPRVVNHEKTHARDISEHNVVEPVDLIVVDVAFIGLRQVLPAALTRLKPGGLVIALIKPQFEAGKEEVDKGRGVIKDAAVRMRINAEIETWVRDELDGAIEGVVPSRIHGPKGNQESLIVFRR